MDINATLLWLVGFSTLGMALNLRRVPMRHAWPMLTGIGLVVASFLILTLLAFPVAGYTVLVIWFLILALPGHLSNRLFVALTLQRYDTARCLLWWLRTLQPSKQHRQQYLLYQGYQRAKQNPGDRFLDDWVHLPGDIGVLAQLFRFRLRGDWEAALQWMSQPHLLHAYSGNIIFLQHHFRALAEVAGPRTAFQRLRLLEPRLIERGLYLQRALLRAEVLAYFGRRDQLELLFATALKQMPTSYKIYLEGICVWAQGNMHALKDTVQRLEIAAADPSYANTLQRKLDRRHLLDRTLPTQTEQELLDQLTVDAPKLAVDPWGWQAGKHPTPVAYTLIALNLAFYIVAEWMGGSTDPDILMQLGSLWPEAVFAGEYWRLLTANFLHLGILHLALNMYFLYFMAGFLEPRLGKWPFLTIYLASGLIAGAISCVWHYYNDPYVQSVGASGCVLGLLGAFAAVRLYAWQQCRALGAKRQFTMVMVLLSLQVFYDLMTPISNGLVHLLGAASGFILTYLWLSLGHSEAPYTALDRPLKLRQ